MESEHRWGDPGQGRGPTGGDPGRGRGQLGVLERRSAEGGAGGHGGRWGEALGAPTPPCQFGEGIKKFLFNYFFLENY